VSRAALSLQSIVKRFGSVTALDGASLTVAPGTIHALLGENGAGKTTLMRIAYGLERPDAGVVQIDDETVALHAATDAIHRGVGMVQQHFSLVPAMTVAENVSLGGQGRFDPRIAAERVRSVSHDTSLQVDPDTRVADLSVAAQQKVELLKVFSRQARMLILDEPTSVLAPSEAQELMALLRRVANDGGAVVLVTHKLREALSVADEVTVLRRGRTVLTISARDTAEDALARAMFPEGVALETAASAQREPGSVLAELRDVDLRDHRAVMRVRRVRLSVHAGEILGVAGVEGSGHHELMLALAGRLRPAAGEIRIPSAIAFIPEHRQRDALIPAFSLIENVALRDAARTRGRMRWPVIARHVGELIQRHGIRTASATAPVSSLSGGNQQKLVLARELAADAPLVIAENPTQGLDAGAAHTIRARLREARDAGAGVVFYTSDLDELLTLADRIVVVFGGAAREVERNADTIGRAMLGAPV
jgi:general nucleoside transport system ATP-binding protein